MKSSLQSLSDCFATNLEIICGSNERSNSFNLELVKPKEVDLIIDLDALKWDFIAKIRRSI